ncbi:ABC transporter permease [Actinoplanes sp. NPDC051494]|uniref:ABC transporter permease n=1 Tax=Actinoplanes sp. NPDC051494 TaxID=3363907 RepID=UPI00379EF9D9
MRLLRAELLKIRTTSTWWVFGLISLVLWALTLGFNWLSTYTLLDMDTTDMSGDDVEQIRAAADVVNVAANLYTNGQFFGLLMVMLLAAILSTSEFFHQTATTTFLLTPRRESVVFAKLGAGVVFGVLFWVVTTLINLIVTPLVLTSLDTASQLGEGAVWSAIGLNGLAYALWAILGVGFGILIRSQLGATITLSLVYVIGSLGATTIFAVIGDRWGDWFQELQVAIPSLASQLMVSGTDLPGNPPRWVGAVVLIAYAVVAGAVGTFITKKRDIA